MTRITTRIWNWQPSTRAVIGLAVLAVSMSFAASAVAAIALARIGPQVQRIDELTKTQTDSIAQASKQAHAACIRTMRLAPALVDDYARSHVFQREYGRLEGLKRLDEARSTIPKRCP